MLRFIIPFHCHAELRLLGELSWWSVVDDSSLMSNVVSGSCCSQSMHCGLLCGGCGGRGVHGLLTGGAFDVCGAYSVKAKRPGRSGGGRLGGGFAGDGDLKGGGGLGGGLALLTPGGGGLGGGDCECGGGGCLRGGEPEGGFGLKGGDCECGGGC